MTFPLTSLRVRADLVLLTKTRLTAVEIKSDRDSLRRLPNQVKHFCQHFDRLILVLARSHAKKILPSLPENVEVWRIDENQITRYAATELSRTGRALLGLMTSRERQRYLSKEHDTREEDGGIRSAFLQCFRDRYGSTSTKFWEASLSQDPPNFNLQLLSRLHEKRTIYSAIKNQQAEQVQAWLKYQSDQDSSVS